MTPPHVQALIPSRGARQSSRGLDEREFRRRFANDIGDAGRLRGAFPRPWRSPSALVRPPGESASPSSRRHECDRRGTSHQHNTHIREPREVCYPWRPWHGRKVWVHTTLVKRGRAVAHCSLEDVQPFRVLEVPLWMLDVAVCCKIRIAKSGLANVESLRELKALLHFVQRARGDIVREAQHRYLLNAGGTDVNIADSRGTPSTPVVCSSASQAALEKSVARCSTEDSAIADAVAAAAWRPISGRGPGRGGAR